ncbi:phosphoribosyl-AMP cyclohydrolase [Agrococcus sp. UYP10]|uniref:phosphoribosyl-AMP cyclohydrolase n=1 Tax=Agrococcus sp. UYP10 TaxID=1756355 RepID=UPI003398C0ED
MSDVPTTPAIADGRLPALKLDADGLVAAVIQDDATGDVLMVGYMDEEALRRTATEGRVTFWSRSRQEYWRKGDTSGNIQVPRSIALDCDGDALLVRVDQTGPACHTGARSCFFTPVPMQTVPTQTGQAAAPRTDRDDA